MEYEFGALKNRFLSKYTTLKVGGMADYVLSAGTNRELSQAISFVHEHELPWFVLGKGSKVLISDSGFRGAVVILERMNTISLSGNELTLGAGSSLVEASSIAFRNSLSGLEWACGIPASAGGAVVMNAGAFGGDMAKIVKTVEVFDGVRFFELANADCGFGYRRSVFQKRKNWIITSVCLGLEKGDAEQMRAKRADFSERRNLSQPKGKCAGSSFKKPDGIEDGISAGELIDKCGLKGYNMGGAVISDLHANFIMNKGTATAKDVESLLELCERKVYSKFHIRLCREIIKIGAD